MPSKTRFHTVRAIGGSVKRSLRSVFRDSKSTRPVLPDHPLSLVCWGVLGVGEGTMEAKNVGWMVSNYGWWSFLLGHAPGYDEARSTLHVLRSLETFFPGGRGVHEEAGCDRLRFPLHPSLWEPGHPPLSAPTLKGRAYLDLVKKASRMTAGETLLLLLIGHGSCLKGVFHLWITTGLGLTGEASFIKEELEVAVADCKARVVVISNACQSGLLRSKHWTLVCAAEEGYKSDALAQSASGYVRGSMFTQCTTAQIALDLGLTPQPRVDERSVTREQLRLAKGHLVALPPFPPTHSLLPGTTPKIGSPTDRGVRELIVAANSHQEFLLFEPAATFGIHPSPSADALPWHKVIPVLFTAPIVDSISLYPDNPEALKTIFGAIQPLYGGPSLQNGEFTNPPALLAGLAGAYAKLPGLAYTPEVHDYRSCIAYVQHLDTPDTVSSPFHYSEVDDFCSMMRARNVQSVAAQYLARALGWWEGDVESFVVRPGGNYRPARQEMMERGMTIKTMLEELCRQTSLSWMSPVEEPPAVLWLLSKWPGADTLSVPKDLVWTSIVSQAVAATADSNMLIAISP
ncbi:hypothetical protein DFH07DRAFT_791779 [Mycena maculata]|uniref:Uncharacterized protein n=1 Tax=Mycena maculata TaxID=230809 RepID=A0AAD7KCL8_9AGAR|nr:hypothetical protein DFH07DRAFT_791779 [Mycena maculata]